MFGEVVGFLGAELDQRFTWGKLDFSGFFFINIIRVAGRLRGFVLGVRFAFFLGGQFMDLFWRKNTPLFEYFSLLIVQCRTALGSFPSVFFCLAAGKLLNFFGNCLLYTSPSPRDVHLSRMPSSA